MQRLNAERVTDGSLREESEGDREKEGLKVGGTDVGGCGAIDLGKPTCRDYWWEKTGGNEHFHSHAMDQSLSNTFLSFFFSCL